MAARQRTFIGLYSGAAMDGIDAAVVEVRGRGERMKVRQVYCAYTPYGDALRTRLVRVAEAPEVSPEALSELDRDVGQAFAAAGRCAIAGAGLSGASAAGIGLSGQAVRRVDPPDGHGGAQELAVGSPSWIAVGARCPAVGNFGVALVAAGGSPSTATAWASWLLLRDRRLSRVAVHLGGLAGLTFLPAAADAADVVAFDVGPGTLVIDQLAERLFGRPTDTDGGVASQASVNGALLNELLADEYFQRRGAKCSCRSAWGSLYSERLLCMAGKHGCNKEDMLATATEATARSIAAAVGGLTERPHEVVLSGGGAMNIHLAGRIRTLLSPSSTYASSRYGVDLRAMQATYYAILAAARMDGVAAWSGPTPDGGRRPVLGEVALP